MYRILFVENNDAIRAGLMTALDYDALGFQPMAASGFTEGLRLSKALQPEVVLVDAHLDGDRGAELIRQLSVLCPGTIPCVLLPAEEFVRMRTFMRAGARDYLLQPVDWKVLLDFLRWALTEGIPSADLISSGEPDTDPVLGINYESLSRSTEKLISLVHTDYREALNLTELAATLGMSSKYIGRVFLKETGMRFSDYLMAWRMREARRLIQNSREKISVIAKLVGFSQPNTFYIHFRNYYGISPGALRSETPEENQEAENAQPIQL